MKVLFTIPPDADHLWSFFSAGNFLGGLEGETGGGGMAEALNVRAAGDLGP